uniref:DegV family protein n=1 Tax=Priestia megaterium TaxID=1404 RepID=UPI001649CFD1
EMIPLCINIHNQTYFHPLELTPTHFIQKIKNSKQLPKTSHPPIPSFLQLYQPLLSQRYHLISIHITARITPTLPPPQTPPQILEPNITLVH